MKYLCDFILLKIVLILPNVVYCLCLKKCQKQSYTFYFNSAEDKGEKQKKQLNK